MTNTASDNTKVMGLKIGGRRITSFTEVRLLTKEGF